MDHIMSICMTFELLRDLDLAAGLQNLSKVDMCVKYFLNLGVAEGGKAEIFTQHETWNGY